MKPQLNQKFDLKAHQSKYWCSCRRCGRKYHLCTTGSAAMRSAVKKGYDIETGLCKLCTLTMEPTEAVAA